jgi:hypothetical protein
MFETDFQQVWRKKSVQSMITNSLGQINAEETAAFKKACSKAYPVIMTTHDFYAAASSGDGFSVKTNSFADFLDDTNLVEPESKFMNQGALDTMFIAANVEQDVEQGASKMEKLETELANDMNDNR